jgi:putative restriction endonuclease
VGSLDEMRTAISKYRNLPLTIEDDPFIGCVFLRDPVFFPVGAASPPPPDFAKRIVQGKGYDLKQPSAAPYFETLMTRLLGVRVELDGGEPWHRGGPVHGRSRLVPQRLGQQAFKAVVLEAYHRRCAVTGEVITPVLQAAHIKPLPAGGEHRLDNALLLRSDVHTLFDRGYLGIDPAHRLLVSPSLKREFSSGDFFYSRAGQPISVPDAKHERPHSDFVAWHLSNVFRST